jgi:four helix bundle protein
VSKKDNIIVTKTFNFACDVLDIEERLIEKRKFVLSKQVGRSGTSIGANVRESQRAVSKPDFINKLGIALKEAEETQYWFELIEKKVFTIDAKVKTELEEIIRILVSIINSSKK